jgi:hypothetical protein
MPPQYFGITLGDIFVVRVQLERSPDSTRPVDEHRDGVRRERRRA